MQAGPTAAISTAAAPGWVAAFHNRLPACSHQHPQISQSSIPTCLAGQEEVGGGGLDGLQQKTRRGDTSLCAHAYPYGLQEVATSMGCRQREGKVVFRGLAPGALVMHACNLRLRSRSSNYTAAGCSLSNCRLRCAGPPSEKNSPVCSPVWGQSGQT